jgi:hypothetical protein
MDRAHRIGQKKEVQVFRFCVENSIEEKVIEKAYKKLRLDALVIQQGRLTENTKTVNKDDLLAMVRYGAEMVFSSEVRFPVVMQALPWPVYWSPGDLPSSRIRRSMQDPEWSGRGGNALS